MKIYVVVTCRSDDEGNNSAESFVFTNQQEAKNKISELYKSELAWFENAVYDPESIDDCHSDLSFDIIDMDCSGLASNAHIEEKELLLSVDDIQNILNPVPTNSVGTQLKMVMLTEFMEENNLSARELARQLDCSFSRICNYLTGKTPITKSFRNLVRAKYNVEII